MATLKNVTHEIGSFDINAKIGELGADVGLHIPIDSVVLDRIKARDTSPEFVTVEIESGISKSKRNWTKDMIEKIVRTVNEKRPVGYRGHIPEKEDHTAFPDVQTVWLGAISERRGDKTVALVKGYNLANAEIRDYLAVGAVSGVSVRGDSSLRPNKGFYDVVDFDLESIDWSRKNREGMSGKIVAITSEMSEGGNSVEPKDIAALDESELRAHAPLLVKEIERKAKQPLETKVSEMETAAAAVEPEIDMLGKIRKMLGLGENDNPVDAVAEAVEAIEESHKGAVRAFVDDAIGKKVKTERGKKLVRRLVGEIEERYTNLTDENKTKIETEISEAIDADDEIKVMIGEMADDGGHDSGTGGSGFGGKRKGLTPNTNEDGTRKNSRITITKRPMSGRV